MDRNTLATWANRLTVGPYIRYDQSAIMRCPLFLYRSETCFEVAGAVNGVATPENNR